MQEHECKNVQMTKLVFIDGQDATKTVLFWAECPFCKYGRKAAWGKISEYFQELQAMKRKAQDAQKKRGKFEPSEDPFFQGLPELNQAMTDEFFDDGKPRDGFTLRFKISSGGASVTMNDPNDDEWGHTTCETVREALEEIEKALANGTYKWKKSNFKKK